MEDERPLLYSQAEKVTAIMSTVVEIQPRANFPSLRVTPARLLTDVKKRLLKKEIKVKSIHMAGSAASYCICKDSSVYPQICYNDLDVVIGVQVTDDSDFHVIKQAVMETLMGFLPQTTRYVTQQLMEKVYIGKMVLVSNQENRWSLISLGNSKSSSRPATTIDLKFEDKIKRKYEFSVDSFQILLDSCLDDAEKSPSSKTAGFFTAVSAYGSYDKAWHHLNHRLIQTRAPEEIRGGGLLKYCSLLVRGFRPAYPRAIYRLQPYMCSRFFIDFPTEKDQYTKINSYVNARFIEQQGCDGQLRAVEFLDNLKYIIKYRAKCLMKRDKRSTIRVISSIQSQVFPAISPLVSVSPLLPIPVQLPVSPLQCCCCCGTDSQYRTHCHSRHDRGATAVAATISYRQCYSSMPACGTFSPDTQKKSTSSHFPRFQDGHTHKLFHDCPH